MRRSGERGMGNGERGTGSRVGAHVCLPGSASPPACRGSASPPASRAALLHLQPAGALLHLQPAGALHHLQPARAVASTAPTASLSRRACQASRCTQRSPANTRTPAKVAPLVGQKKPATYPRRPGRSQTAWTIPTVPCPSCQTASRRYAHSHRCPAIKQLLCQSGSTDLRLLADGLGWRPPPRNPPDKPPALRYCPGETAEMAIRHPSAHSATTPSCSPAVLPTGSTASEMGDALMSRWGSARTVVGLILTWWIARGELQRPIDCQNTRAEQACSSVVTFSLRCGGKVVHKQFPRQQLKSTCCQHEEHNLDPLHRGPTDPPGCVRGHVSLIDGTGRSTAH
jgi:hypothetical protein